MAPKPPPRLRRPGLASKLPFAFQGWNSTGVALLRDRRQESRSSGTSLPLRQGQAHKPSISPCGKLPRGTIGAQLRWPRPSNRGARPLPTQEKHRETTSIIQNRLGRDTSHPPASAIRSARPQRSRDFRGELDEADKPLRHAPRKRLPHPSAPGANPALKSRPESLFLT